MIPFGTVVEMNDMSNIHHGIQGNAIGVDEHGRYLVEFSYNRLDGSVQFRCFAAYEESLIIIEDDNEET